MGRISNEVCAFLTSNIPGYDCGVTLAQYAGQPDVIEKPDDVDYKFWEDNVWELQGYIADLAGDETVERGNANRPSDRGLF